MNKISEQTAERIIDDLWLNTGAKNPSLVERSYIAGKLAHIIATEYAPVTRLLEDMMTITLDVPWQDSSTGNAISVMKRMQRRAQKLLEDR